MSHPEITSISEPWLLLPLAYMTSDNEEILTPYNHTHAQQAIADMVKLLPNQENDYHEAVSHFVEELFMKLCGDGNNYFVDKTPRNYLIIPFIERCFPEAKFIFLYRNPLAIMASMIDTWGRGRFTPRYGNHVDIYEGPHLLVDNYIRMQSKSTCVCFEDLVATPEIVINKVFNYLGLSHDSTDIAPVDGGELRGVMGDKTGIVKYSNIYRGDLDGWKHAYTTRYRKLFARKYLDTIGGDVLSTMGYSIDDILSELEDIKPVKGIGVLDAIDDIRTIIYYRLTSGVIRKILKKVLIPGCLFWSRK